MNRIGTATALFAALTLLAAPAAAQRCPVTKGTPKVYAIGSSTLGSVLGPMLQHILKEEGVEMHRWGRASSGLARPDFHDWLALAPGLMRKHEPDVVVVSLGTNDFQPLFVKKGKWIHLESEKWETVYAKRVDKLLTIIGGKKKQRLVVWMGPHAFAGERAEARGPIVNRIMRERVEAYAAAGGNAVFVDAFDATRDKRGRPLEEAKLPGSSKVERIRTPDNIHLTTDGVRWLMAEPILAQIRPCLPGAEPIASSDDGARAAEAKADTPDAAGAPPDGTAALEAKVDDPGPVAKDDGDGASAEAPREDEPAHAEDDSGEAPQANDEANDETDDATEGGDEGEAPAQDAPPSKSDDDASRDAPPTPERQAESARPEPAPPANDDRALRPQVARVRVSPER